MRGFVNINTEKHKYLIALIPNFTEIVKAYKMLTISL